MAPAAAAIGSATSAASAAEVHNLGAPQTAGNRGSSVGDTAHDPRGNVVVQEPTCLAHTADHITIEDACGSGGDASHRNP